MLYSWPPKMSRIGLASRALWPSQYSRALLPETALPLELSVWLLALYPAQLLLKTTGAYLMVCDGLRATGLPSKRM